MAGVEIWYIIYCEAAHFTLGFCVGLSVYYLTLTILSHITGLQGLMGASFIHRFSFGLALLFSLCAHIVQDYTLNIF